VDRLLDDDLQHWLLHSVAIDQALERQRALASSSSGNHGFRDSHGIFSQACGTDVYYTAPDQKDRSARLIWAFRFAGGLVYYVKSLLIMLSKVIGLLACGS
jgi:hypothetical protein